MSPEGKKAYERTFGQYPNPDVGLLPEAVETDSNLIDYFLWGHVRIVRSIGKKLPLKPRRRLSPDDEADLKRNLEMIAHQARHALAYLAK